MKNLKILRKNNNLTLTELSLKVGISHQMLSYYETNKANPPIEIIIKLADCFGCSVDYLLGHKTKDLIYISELTLQQTKIISEIKQMSDDDLLIVEGVLLRLKQEKETPWKK